MCSKLQKCIDVLCSETAQLAQILDPRFSSDLISYFEILRRYIVIPSASEHESGNANNLSEPPISSGVNFMQSVLNGDSLQDCYDDEVVS